MPDARRPQVDTATEPARRQRTDQEEQPGGISTRSVLLSVLFDVALPFGIYLGLSAAGVPEVWALAAAGGVALARALVGWVRHREVNALSILLVVRFSLGVILAALTGEARLVLAKDTVVTALIGTAMLGTLLLAKPALYYLRRTFTTERDRWDRWWVTSSAFRRFIRKLNWVWGLSLIADAAVRAVIIYTAPIDVAALASQAIAALTILALLGWTQWFERGMPTDPDP